MGHQIISQTMNSCLLGIVYLSLGPAPNSYRTLENGLLKFPCSLVKWLHTRAAFLRAFSMYKAPQFDCATGLLKCLLDNICSLEEFFSFSLPFVFLDGERTSGWKKMGGILKSRGAQGHRQFLPFPSQSTQNKTFQREECRM